MSALGSMTRRFAQAFLLFGVCAGGDADAACKGSPYIVGSGLDCAPDAANIQDVINTTVGCPAITIYVSTAQVLYTGQAVTISGRDVNIEGVNHCAGRVEPAPFANLDGTGAVPVIAVSGDSHVVLTNLLVKDGYSTIGGGVSFQGSGSLSLSQMLIDSNVASNLGGGVGFYGSGKLTLNNVSLSNNQARYGGGLGAGSDNAFGSHADVVITDNSTRKTDILDNTAQYGGGIAVLGYAGLRAVTISQDGLKIHGNKATHPGQPAFGGGIYFAGDVADIGIRGQGINSNQADFGGGIAVVPSDVGDAVLRLFSPHSEAQNIGFNNAGVGGGLYVDMDNETFGTRAHACLYDVSMSQNTAAQNGAAVGVGQGGELRVNVENDDIPQCSFAAVTALGAQHCSGSACNVFDQNPPASAAGGSTIYADYGSVRLSHLRLTGAHADALLRSVTHLAQRDWRLDNCIIAQNTTTSVLLDLSGNPANIDSCTFADNTIGGANVITTDSTLNLRRSILRESRPILATTASFSAMHVIANEIATLGNGATLQATDPAFVAAGDYHLAANSPAIDYAPNGNEYSSTDFDRHLREFDAGSRSNLFGPRDLGGYEAVPACYVNDTVFCNGFEVP